MPSSAMNGERPSSPPRADTPVLTAGVWLFVVAAGLLMAAARPVHYLLFHTLAELIAISVAISVFTLTWATRQHLHNGYLVIVSAAYALRVVGRLCLGGEPHATPLPDLNRSEFVAASVLAIGIVAAGVYPAPLIALSAASVREIARLFGT